MRFRCLIMLFALFPCFTCIIFLTPDNFALLRPHVWIPRGKQHDLPTITPSGRARSANVCVAGDAAFAVRYALRNAAAGGDEDDDMSRVPLANPYARVRDFIARLVCLRRELDIVPLARTVKIRKPIIPIGDVCISARNACLHLPGDFAATEI